MKDELIVDYNCDLCVIGGGIAGICAAVAAAREGAKVVLMHERPVLGGNASSEIRMWVCGAQGKNVAETGIMEEIFLKNLHLNPYKLYPMFDAVLFELVKSEKNITLLLNCTCCRAQMNAGGIKSVTGWQMTTQRFCRVSAPLFADCSGDSVTAVLAGADYRAGREAAAEFGEDVSTLTADKKTMGNSCLIQAHKGSERVTFTPPAFAKKLTDDDVKYRCPNLSSPSENYWYLELGGERDTIGDAELIRDDLVALAFGMWDYIKNSGRFEDADFWQLDFAGFLPGKRESRRLLGKVMLTQGDILAGRQFEDTAAFGGWPLDDHDPAGFYYDGHPNTSYSTPAPYAIPYRALYSRNVNNLFFAGRNISATHAALSSTRVMGTCGVCGQAIGTAAALAAKYACLPDDIYTSHLAELQSTLMFNDCLLPGLHRTPCALTGAAELTVNGKKSKAAEGLRDGSDRENAFECAAGDRIEYTFASPVSLNMIRLVFDSDLDRETLPGDRCERTHMTRCNLLPDSPVMHLPLTLCSEYVLTAETVNGRLITIADEKMNISRLVKIPCAAKDVVKLTLIPGPPHGGGQSCTLFAFEAE